MPAQNSSEIRVAHFFAGGERSGIDTYIYNLVRSLSGENVRFLIICSRPSQIIEELAASQNAGYELNGHKKCQLQLLSAQGFGDLAAMSQLRQILKDWGADILHVHTPVDAFIGGIAAKLSGVPIVKTIHMSPEKAPPLMPDAGRLLNYLTSKICSYRLPVSKAAATPLLARKRMWPMNMRIVHPGVPKFEMSVEERTALRTTGSGSGIVALSVGRLEPEKGFDTLVKAASIACERIPELRFMLIGTGSQKADLEKQISSAGLEQRFRLLGYVPSILPALSSASFFVMPSRKETFGIAAVEAMMAGLPVIGSSGTGLEEIIEHKRTGWLVPPTDADALAEAIMTLAADVRMREKMSYEAERHALARHSSDIMARKILYFYKASIGRV